MTWLTMVNCLMCGFVVMGAAAGEAPQATSTASLPAMILRSASEKNLQTGAYFAPPSINQPELKVIAPALLEICWTAQDSAIAVSNQIPAATNQFVVNVAGQTIAPTVTGIRRRAAYAPFKQRDLRIGTSLFLELSASIPENSAVEVLASGQAPWPGPARLVTVAGSNRLSPAMHVNQTGYLPGESKKARLGYYLGTLGEADLVKLLGAAQTLPRFAVLDLAGKEVFSGSLTLRPDQGFPYPAYQQVLEADFSGLTTPGAYRLRVPGLGVSRPFRIDEGVASTLARTYALGLYHQRCGGANALPFSRFTHRDCHTAAAVVPDNTEDHGNSNWTLETEAGEAKKEPRHVAPALTNVAASLYPFVNRGPVDVRGGHHDAGDYSKYTINSASFVHCLVTACDSLPGVAALDNLGLPESGDGKGDVLQEAKWEADFLAKMQDTDGGFYFLVYPKGRRYENDVPPDRGDPQVVFPKTTASTAAAVAALAQCASSAQFRKQFPDAAVTYLDRARKGWAFLTNALAVYGKDGAYQKITHYGHDFLHDDELAWAAVELYLATGEQQFREKVTEWFKPNDPELRKWGWVRLFDAQGNAVRSYALAVQSGRVQREQLDPALYEVAVQELRLAADDQARRSRQSAYGTSFPEETKRVNSAGWYFSLDAAFDLALASQLQDGQAVDTPGFREAILDNINYEQGCNPVDVCYLTGLGDRRQLEVVHQYALNDRRVMPPDGIPLGNIQGGISWIDLYKDEPARFSIPSDEAPNAPYPFYDRWTDAWNLSQEFVILNQAKGLAVNAWLMANSSLKDQPWKAATAAINGAPARIRAGQTYRLELAATGLDLSEAVIIWEAEGGIPLQSKTFEWRPSKSNRTWVEAEAQLPDGRRVFGALER